MIRSSIKIESRNIGIKSLDRMIETQKHEPNEIFFSLLKN